MQKQVWILRFVLLPAMLFAGLQAKAQPNVLQGITNRISNLGASSGGGVSDSLLSRKQHEETVAVRFYYLDSTRTYTYDSSILDYTHRFPIPATHIFLGNTGTATRSILFAPPARAGFDPGFHAFDVYKFRLDQVRLFNVNRPFTELSYTLAAGAEQLIEVLHTQNPKPTWNVSFRYRLINAPGTFSSQTANHNNILLTSWVQSKNRRYNNYVVLLSNNQNAAENGGIRNLENLSDPTFENRLTVPTFIGGQTAAGNNNFFSTAISTGNQYREVNFLLRQQYDFGRKDSLVTDSTVIPLFYPRLRFEHTFKYGSYRYNFIDQQASSRSGLGTYAPDSVYYDSLYGIKISADTGSINLIDRWQEISNDFSIYQFPDAQNLQQFIKVGVEAQLLNGEVRTSRRLYNIIGHGEYRNRTKNQVWDISAWGRLWLSGYNAGDYHAYVSLQRLISAKLGSLQAGFENINRTPPFIYNQTSQFYLDAPTKTFGKENTIHLFASFLQPRFQVQLRGDYYLITNYLYLRNYRELMQEPAAFNVLRVSASKTFRLGRNFRWHADVYLQRETGDVPVNMPLLFTRNRVGYEGKLGLPHLNVAAGLEIRYHSPYKADGYSPVLGQFFYQDSVTISNRPQVDAYLHLRIRGFRAFLRYENLNTIDFRNGFGFTNHNFAAPGYPMAGGMLRLGIFWGFVN
jgi:hypothetical protein